MTLSNVTAREEDTEPHKVSPFQLLQWKHWLRMEEAVKAKGLPRVRHSRGSVKARAARSLGLTNRSPRKEVLERIQKALDACDLARVPLPRAVSFKFRDGELALPCGHTACRQSWVEFKNVICKQELAAE